MAHPAEHRAIRELHATTRQLKKHWRKLAASMHEPLLDEGARQAGELLRELDARVELRGRPAAQSVGASLAGFRGVSDLFLERNQAFRSALLDLNHVTTLLRYLAALSHEEWLDAWATRFEALEERGRERAVEMAAEPDTAIAPADQGTAGRAGARLGVTVGTVGEAFDNSPLGRLARRRAT